MSEWVGKQLPWTKERYNDRHQNGHSHNCMVWVNCQQCDGPDLTQKCDCGKEEA